MWLIGVVVCLLAALLVQLFADVAMDGRMVQCGIISSCQSAATSKILKCFSSCLTHVRSVQVLDLHLFIFLVASLKRVLSRTCVCLFLVDFDHLTSSYVI